MTILGLMTPRAPWTISAVTFFLSGCSLWADSQATQFQGGSDASIDSAGDVTTDVVFDVALDSVPSDVSNDALPDTSPDASSPCDVDGDRSVREGSECDAYAVANRHPQCPTIGVCPRDCDDNNPAVNPFARVLCGDGVQNRCGSLPVPSTIGDPLIQALGGSASDVEIGFSTYEQIFAGAQSSNSTVLAIADAPREAGLDAMALFLRNGALGVWTLRTDGTSTTQSLNNDVLGCSVGCSVFAFGISNGRDSGVVTAVLSTPINGRYRIIAQPVTINASGTILTNGNLLLDHTPQTAQTLVIPQMTTFRVPSAAGDENWIGYVAREAGGQYLYAYNLSSASPVTTWSTYFLNNNTTLGSGFVANTAGARALTAGGSPQDVTVLGVSGGTFNVNRAPELFGRSTLFQTQRESVTSQGSYWVFSPVNRGTMASPSPHLVGSEVNCPAVGTCTIGAGMQIETATPSITQNSLLAGATLDNRAGMLAHFFGAVERDGVNQRVQIRRLVPGSSSPFAEGLPLPVPGSGQVQDQSLSLALATRTAAGSGAARDIQVASLLSSVAMADRIVLNRLVACPR